ncbi:MAG TPA: Npt1/Npt2 family nucleotide transporter [Candidatus Binatia bacterium]|jgi:AAA family ATP:ADP antiporter
MATADSRPPNGFDRFLRIFADVRTGEGGTALLLGLNVFLILMAYYVLKPVREALVLGEGSAAAKTYLSVVEVFLLAGAVPAYGALVRRMDRRLLINSVTGFFVVCLLIFYALGQAGVHIGMAFFLWISIFNMMVVAQFWSFANDLYSKDEGERLFPIVGFGASFGAVAGAAVAGGFIEKLGTYSPMLVGAAILVLETVLTNLIDVRESRRGRSAAPRAAMTKEPAARGGAFGMVLRTRYLLLIALMLLLHNAVKTTGEFLLSTTLQNDAISKVGAGDPEGIKRLIGASYSYFFAWVNTVGLITQLFLVSRIVKKFGVQLAVLVLPLVALTGYSAIGLAPVLGVVFAAKVAENSTDYSLNNTVRNMLFLPCTTEQKYSAKQAIDSFFVRLGDVTAAAVVFILHDWLTLGSRAFALVNAGLVAVWLLLAWRIGRNYSELTSHDGTSPPTTA